MSSPNRESSSSCSAASSLDSDRRARRMALDALERDASKVWTELPGRFQVDKECVLKALRSTNLPPKSEFERQFPQSLRFDRDVVLAFCARDDFPTLYKERHLFVPDCLTNDKQVMLAYCQKIPRSLQECSEALISDRDVVAAAVKLDGLELQYASRQLQQDRELVVLACQSNGRALEFCPEGSDLRNELVNNRDFMLQVLRKHGGPMLRLVPEPLRHDRELLLEALKHGLRFRFIPVDFMTDQDFLLEALQKRADLYLEMHRGLQSSEPIAYAAMVSNSSVPSVQKKVLTYLPDLVQHREVVLSMAKRGELDDISLLIRGDARAAPFQDDREIMLHLIHRDCRSFAYASARLKRDTEIILAALDEESASDVLAAVGPEALRQHPEIVVRAISVYPRRNLRVLRTQVPDELWTQRPVAVAYIQRAGRVLDVFDNLLQNDREMALCVAEHAGPDFGRVGEALRSDLEFMKEAVDKNGRVLRLASPELRDNLELLLRAIAQTPHAAPRAAGGANGGGIGVPPMRHTRQSIQQYVQTKLDLHQMFVEEFLRGIAVARPHLPPAQRSQLTMLDRGVETSQAFKLLIAEFLGVPIGEELRILRTALLNLTNPAPPDTSNQEPRESVFMMDRWARRRAMRAQRLAGAAAADNDNAFPPGDLRIGFGVRPPVAGGNAAAQAGAPQAGVAAAAPQANQNNNNDHVAERLLAARRRRMMANVNRGPRAADMELELFAAGPAAQAEQDMLEEEDELFHMMWEDEMLMAAPRRPPFAFGNINRPNAPPAAAGQEAEARPAAAAQRDGAEALARAQVAHLAFGPPPAAQENNVPARAEPALNNNNPNVARPAAAAAPQIRRAEDLGEEPGRAPRPLWEDDMDDFMVLD